MAMEAAELPGFGARTHPPERVSVVFPEIAAVRIEIVVFQGRQLVVVEVPVAGAKGGGYGGHLGMAGSAGLIILLHGEVPSTSGDFEILRNGPFRRFLTYPDVFITRTVAGLAVNSRLGPDRVVGVGFQIVV